MAQPNAPATAKPAQAARAVVAPGRTVAYGKRSYGPGEEVPFSEADADEATRLAELGHMVAKAAYDYDAKPNLRGTPVIEQKGDGPRVVLA